MSRGTLILGKLGDGAELAALIEDRRIADWVYGPAQQPAPEALYKARVDRVVAPSAFVGLGADAQGYLRDAKVDTSFIAHKAGKLTSLALLGVIPPSRFPLSFYRSDPAPGGVLLPRYRENQ